MKTLESELDLWEEHWSQSKTCLPDSVSTTKSPSIFYVSRLLKLL